MYELSSEGHPVLCRITTIHVYHPGWTREFVYSILFLIIIFGGHIYDF